MPYDIVEANRQVAGAYAKTVSTPAPTAPIMARLMTGLGTASANGTEVQNAGGSAYAPQSVTAATPSSPTAGVLTSNAPITYTNMPDTSGPGGVKGIETWDSASTPRRIQLGSLAATKVTNLGDSLTIASGQFSANATL
jgi:hypothetical protein